jgi:hypothetical protein
MKKIVLLTVLSATTCFAMAQDLDEVTKWAYLNQNAKAKEAVDKYLAVEKNAKKPEGWYWKAYITNQLSKDSTKSITESSTMKMDAFETFKKYKQMDAKAPLLEEQTNSPLFDIYLGLSSDLAIKAYNAKDPAGAYDNFKKAVEVHDYIYSNNITGNNGFKFSALDTTIVLYTAISANEAKKPEDAVPYYTKIVDAGVTGDNYADAYNFLVDYYKKKKDKAAFADILTKARKAYPKNEEYWMAVEIEDAVDGIEKPAVFAKYDELVAKYPTNYTVSYNYGVELYNYLNGEGAKDANVATYKTRLAEVLKKAIGIQSTFDANFLLTNFLYNNSFDISEDARKVKGVKPEDVKKKKALEADATKMMNDAIPYGEEALKQYDALQKPKTSDKVHRKQVLTMMKNIYDVKKDAAKVAQYEKLITSAE